MAGLQFVGKALNTIPSEVEVELRKELGLTQPIAYTLKSLEDDSIQYKDHRLANALKAGGIGAIEQLTGAIPLAGTPIAKVLTGVGAGVLQGVGVGAIEGLNKQKQFVLSGIIRFDIPQPRQAILFVQIIRREALSIPATLIYTTTLNKHLSGEVVLEKEESKDARIRGDAKAIEWLKGNSQLLKQINAFCRSKFESIYATNNKYPYRFNISGQSVFSITPQGRDLLIVAQTLPTKKLLTLGSIYRLDAKEFFNIVNELETRL